MQMKYLTVILISILFASCELLTDAIPPVDFYWHPPAEEIQVDTCTDYETVTQPPFITFAVNLDVLPDTLIFYKGNTPINIESYLSQFGTDFTIYESGINIAITLKGTNNNTQFNSPSGRIFTRDGNGTKYAIVCYRQALQFHGAVTFDQYRAELTDKPSAKYIGSWNTAFTCEQWEMIVQFLLDNCISGHGKIIDRRYFNCTLPSEQEAYLIESGWTQFN